MPVKERWGMAAYHIRYKRTPDVEPPKGPRRRIHLVQEIATFAISALVMYGVWVFVRKLWH
ncbi:MAG: hypothetical protein ABI765_06795 [Gemmatimonadota bacterium]